MPSLFPLQLLPQPPLDTSQLPATCQGHQQPPCLPSWRSNLDTPLTALSMISPTRPNIMMVRCFDNPLHKRFHYSNFQNIVMEDQWEVVKESLSSLTWCYLLTITLALLVTIMRAPTLTMTSIPATMHVHPRSEILEISDFQFINIL